MQVPPTNELGTCRQVEGVIYGKLVSHIILYAKRFYQESELLNDLRAISAFQFGCDPQVVPLQRIAMLLLNAYQEIRSGSSVSEDDLRHILLFGLDPKGPYSNGADPDDY